MCIFIWGSKWEHPRKEGGLECQKSCPECDKFGLFYEVVPTKRATAYFVPLWKGETKKPLLECSNCQARFYIQESDYHRGREQYQKKQEKPSVIQLPASDYTLSSIVTCNQCGQKLSVPDKDVKIKVTCVSCKHVFFMKKGDILTD